MLDFRDAAPDSKTISEMAQVYNVSLRTLRFYEDKGLLSPLRVGLVRLYDAKDEIRLQLILKGRRFGFSLSEIEALILDKQAKRAATTDLDLPEGIIADRIEILEGRRNAIAAAIDELKLALTE